MADFLLDCYSPQLRPLVITALHTGFQASKLQSLTWDGVDVWSRTITVHAGYAEDGEACSVSINQLLTDTWKSVKLANYQGDRSLCNRASRSYRSLGSAFEPAVGKAEVRDVTFHDLRHLWVSLQFFKTLMPP